jgi:hypothetical protein
MGRDARDANPRSRIVPSWYSMNHLLYSLESRCRLVFQVPIPFLILYYLFTWAAILLNLHKYILIFPGILIQSFGGCNIDGRSMMIPATHDFLSPTYEDLDQSCPHRHCYFSLNGICMYCIDNMYSQPITNMRRDGI